jgi:Ca2+-binding RTX toxin-like protein
MFASNPIHKAARVLLQGLRRPSRPTGGAARRNLRRGIPACDACEPLEGRLLFAFTTSFRADGTLVGTGDATSESIQVAQENVNGAVYTRIIVNGVQKMNATGAIPGVIINGSDGADTITIISYTAGAPPVTLNGNSGRDTLIGNDGNDTLQGGDDMDHIFGGAGNDYIEGNAHAGILLGGTGDDEIHGGVHRDLLIGGAGSDGMAANEEGDILVTGSTSYDGATPNWAGLEKILDEWRSGNTYETKIANILNGTGLTGGNRLNPTGASPTVFHDSALDSSQGYTGRDWFISSWIPGDYDYFGDLANDETVTSY